MYFLLAVLAVALLAIFGLVRTTAAAERAAPPPATPPITVAAVKRLNKADLARMLSQIERADATKSATVTAMCYVPASDDSAPYAIYVCPKCGNKTIYVPSREGFGMVFNNEIQTCRQLVKAIGEKVSGVTLDESSFCRQCLPGNDTHRLVLRVVYDDGATNKTAAVFPDDLRLLKDTLNGKLESFSVRGYGRLPSDTEASRLLSIYVQNLRSLLDLKQAPTPLTTNAPVLKPR